MKMALDGQGILNWWFSWTMSAFSEGKLAAGGIMPVRAGSDSHWNGKHRRTRLSYSGSGAPTALIEPAATDDDRTPVPPDLRAGALDLAGAVLAGMSRLSAGVDNAANGKGSCDVDEPVFDGRRRYNLVLEHLGRDVLEKNDYSVFSGPALRCGVKIDRIAGFRLNPPTSKWRKSDGATLWVGRAFANFPPVPVRLELETLLGALRVHLVRASLTEGGKIRRLAGVR
jgi:hypothetical protein